MIDVSAFGDKVQYAGNGYNYPDPQSNNFGVRGADNYVMYDYKESGNLGCDFSHHCQDDNIMMFWTELLKSEVRPEIEFNR